ncbi:hypothetical protein [Halomonas sp. M4R1S46]|uniref:hypothetical protein n=1 Tax=Halomonas sp. M4R1S46 TaxID=2982692 RepID=UPI0021E448F2|nr:hypothetical protein [Halomonas sp. M4R1S46]UYG06854.1 hypothetical protein OCT48_14660 [Halomonas sp. M4R1S46]
MADTLIPLTTEMHDETLEQMELFRLKFRELWKNWESLKNQGVVLGGGFTKHGDGKVSGQGCGVEVHRLKGFYLDFRFFWGQKETTEYFKISSLLGKHCTDGRLHKCLKCNKEQWRNAGFLHEWHGIKSDEMIDVLFNGELFHSNPSKRERMRQIQILMSNDLAHLCLVHSLYDRMCVIRNINWIIQPLAADCQMVRVPAEYAQRNHAADAHASSE